MVSNLFLIKLPGVQDRRRGGDIPAFEEARLPPRRWLGVLRRRHHRRWALVVALCRVGVGVLGITHLLLPENTVNAAREKRAAR
jgi:hypothetical protein